MSSSTSSPKQTALNQISSHSHVTPRKQARNLLRDYYGIGPATKKADPFDIDGVTFEADKYLQKLLQEKQLNALIQKDNELITEIRQLDGDMKTLVYENYSKFISATDTIRKMKSNVENIELEMDRLTLNTLKISEKASMVNEALGPRREKIRQLNGVHNLLKKLQFMFELPTRLTQCLEKESYGQAVRYYSRTTRLLTHYGHLSAFSGIQKECEEIMNRIAVKIRQGMSGKNASGDEITEFVLLLIELKEPSPKLWKEYIELQIDYLTGLQTRTFEKIGRSPLEPSSPLTSQINEIDHLDDIFLKELNTFVESFQSCFLNPAQIIPGSRRSSNAARVSTDRNNAELVVRAELDSDERERARMDLFIAVEPLLSSFFSVVKDMLANLISLPHPSRYGYILNRLYMDVKEKFRGLRDVLNIDIRIKKMISDWEIGLITNLMTGAQQGLSDRLQAIVKKITENTNETENPRLLATFIIDSEGWLKNFLTLEGLNIIDEAINLDVGFLKTRADKEEFLENIRFGLRKGWEDILQSLKSANRSPAFLNSTVLVLLSSKLCFDISQSIVGHTYEAFSQRIFPILHSSSYSHRTDESLIQMHPTLFTDWKEVVIIGNDYGQVLLDGYTETLGHKLAHLIETFHVSNSWFEEDKLPQKVTQVWELILERINSIENEVEAVYPSDEEDNRGELSSSSTNPHRRHSIQQLHNNSALQGIANSAAHLYASSNPSVTSFTSITSATNTNIFQNTINQPQAFGSFGLQNNLLSNIDKLFSERVEIFTKVEPTRLSICGAVVKMVVKAYIETLRGLTMEKAGFWQIQVDAEWLRVYMWKFVADEKLINNMLDEAIGNAFRRCHNPEPLQHQVTERIIGHH